MSDIIISFIEREFLPAGEKLVDSEDELLTGGVINSMGLMKLVRFLENKHNIQIPFEDISVENFNSVKNISTYLAEKHLIS